MMGRKAAQPELYVSFSLDAAVPRHHILRKIAAAIDFEFVPSLAAPYYSWTGQPSVDPVVIFKLHLLGYLFNIRSERQLCEEASLHLAWRWFLGYELSESIPDHSVLTKARRRFGVAVYAQFFKRVVQACEDRGLIQGRRLYVDSTLVEAHAAVDSVRSRQILRQLPGKPESYLAKLELEADEGRSRPGRKRRMRIVGEEVASRTDPDAALISRRAGRKPRLVHKVHLGVDGGQARIVTAVTAVPAGHGDGQGLPAILDQHHLNTGSRSEEIVADTGYAGANAYRTCLDRGVLPSIRSHPSVNRRGGYDRDRFTYDAANDRYICPQGHPLVRVHDNVPMKQHIYRASLADCRACPVRQECNPGARASRIVSRSFDHDLLEVVAEHLKSPRARDALRRRKQFVELVIADAKVRHGMHRAQRRGRDNMFIQAVLTVTAMNLLKLAQHSRRVQTGAAALISRQIEDLEAVFGRVTKLLKVLWRLSGPSAWSPASA
jgi:transposase